MKDLKLERLTPAECTELQRLTVDASKATKRRVRKEEGCRAAYSLLAQRRAELATAEEAEQQALSRLNKFLAAHRQEPQPRPQANSQVADAWARRCNAEALHDAERARKAQFTKLG